MCLLLILRGKESLAACLHGLKGGPVGRNGFFIPEHRPVNLSSGIWMATGMGRHNGKRRQHANTGDGSQSGWDVHALRMFMTTGTVTLSATYGVLCLLMTRTGDPRVLGAVHVSLRCCAIVRDMQEEPPYPYSQTGV
jgi:hypothetical protein